MITYLNGDVTGCYNENVIVAHICNNVGVYNAGVAKAIRNKWPKAYEKYKSNTPYWLGKNINARISTQFWVVNMIAQKGLRSKSNPKPIDYKALEMCLIDVNSANIAYSVHMPKIGTGLAGGDWAIIEPMIDAIFVDRNVYVWEL